MKSGPTDTAAGGGAALMGAEVVDEVAAEAGAAAIAAAVEIAGTAATAGKPGISYKSRFAYRLRAASSFLKDIPAVGLCNVELSIATAILNVSYSSNCAA